MSGQMVFWQLFSSLLINSIVTDGDFHFINKVWPGKGKNHHHRNNTFQHIKKKIMQ